MLTPNIVLTGQDWKLSEEANKYWHMMWCLDPLSCTWFLLLLWVCYTKSKSIKNSLFPIRRMLWFDQDQDFWIFFQFLTFFIIVISQIFKNSQSKQCHFKTFFKLFHFHFPFYQSCLSKMYSNPYFEVFALILKELPWLLDNKDSLANFKTFLYLKLFAKN